MSNQQPLTMSRRRFLTGAAALAAALLLAGLWPKRRWRRPSAKRCRSSSPCARRRKAFDRRPLGRVRGHRAGRQDGGRAAGAGRSVSE
ncbi:twin-arginine translocation signal domain-containing protein [Serratia ureilytica]